MQFMREAQQTASRVLQQLQGDNFEPKKIEQAD
jgi:hypothetical protein